MKLLMICPGSRIELPIENEIANGMFLATSTMSVVQMKVSELAARAGMQIVSPVEEAVGDVLRVYAADTMSELIAHASSGTLLVTHLDNAQLARVAELMDAPAVCLVDREHPAPGLLEAARRAGAAVMVSRLGLADTVRRFEELLQP
jgi:hypothetical protein